MKRSILTFDKTFDDEFHTIIRNNHGRRLYLKVALSGEKITIYDCFYIDRPMRNGIKAIPRKQTTLQCSYIDLTDVLAAEIDKRFYGIEFSDTENKLSTEEYIRFALQDKHKYKFLILVESNGMLKTRLKNRVHRTIYIEIKCSGGKGLIHKCHYCDRRYKRNNQFITPSELNTIYFDYSTEKVLEIANTELNCDFTDIIITSDTFNFDKTNIPVCGSI